MNKALRKAVIAGNWKMNKTPSEAKALITELKPLVANADCDVVICVPYVDLQVALEETAGSNIHVGAENCHWAESGAFTGEVAAPMLKEMGVEYVVIGHSERRQYFGETDDTVRDRTRAALDNGLKVILCVGETLEQREKNITFETIAIQTKIALTGVSEAELDNVIIAYEPVWAIGTGKTATDEQANEVNHFIRTLIADLYSKEAADKFVVQYGGSMNAGNAEGLVAQEDIDGGLIGGASLKPADFAKIVEAASKYAAVKRQKNSGPSGPEFFCLYFSGLDGSVGSTVRSGDRRLCAWGSLTAKQVPRSSENARLISPLCFSTIFWAMERPRP